MSCRFFHQAAFGAQTTAVAVFLSAPAPKFLFSDPCDTPVYAPRTTLPTPPPPFNPSRPTLVQFFRDLADRQAALCQQQALEAVLLRQATAAIWSARGKTTGTERDDVARTSPLGPRLAWLACEELTSFFQQHAYTTSSGNATARRRVGEGSATSAAVSPLGLLQPLMPPHYHPATASVGISDGNASRGGAFGVGVGVGVSGDDSGFEQLVKQAVARMDLNLVLPGSSHRGTAFDPTSPCGFCGLALECDIPSIHSDDGVGYASGDRAAMVSTAASEGVELVVKACGHGFHARCLAGGSHGRGGGGKSGGWGDVESMPLPCPQCM